MDNTNFLVGELRPMCGKWDKDEDGNLFGSGRWLGHSYCKSIDRKLYSVKTVIQGIMEHQRQLSLKQIKESEAVPENAKRFQVLNSNQQSEIKKARAQLV